MNKFLTILYSTILLVACSTTEDPILPSPTPGDGEVAIGFLSQTIGVDSLSTRASNSNSLKNFFVYGYKTINGEVFGVFDGTEVQYDEELDSYDYVTPDVAQRYWDANAQIYRFFGYAGNTGASCAGNTVTFDGSEGAEELKSNDYYYSKLLRRDMSTHDYSTVVLTFKRPYCNVRVIFLDADDNPITDDLLSSMDATFSRDGEGITTKGKVQIAYSTTGAEDSQTISIIEPVTTESLAIEGTDFRPQFPVPDGLGECQIHATIHRERRTAVIPEEYTRWQTNFNYSYYIRVSNMTLCDVKIEDWTGKIYTQPLTNW